MYLNLEFLDGTRGAHVNISGISGVATKTSYATFLLYSLFHSGVLGAEALNTKALDLQREGRGPAVPRPRQHRPRRRRGRPLPRLGLPAGAVRQLAVCAPPRRGDRQRGAPTSPAAPTGVALVLLDDRGVLREELLPFLFADAEDDRQQYTMVVHNVAARLKHARPSRPATAR